MFFQMFHGLQNLTCSIYELHQGKTYPIRRVIMMKTTTKEPTYTMASLDKIVGYLSQMIINSCFISMHKK